MANKTPDQLTSATSAADTDLLLIYPTGGPLKKFTWSTFIAQVVTALGNTVLLASNNLSDLASASAARANLGLGTAATLASSALFQVSNNLSEVANAATARANLGAAASTSPTITGGMDLSGAVKQNVQAIAAGAIDTSLGEVFTKSISADTTFTFTGATTAKASGFVLKLTISSDAAPTFPSNVEWDGASQPDLTNGKHMLAFLTDDGGTTWYGSVFGTNFGPDV